jgi:hypothetical protein
MSRGYTLPLVPAWCNGNGTALLTVVSIIRLISVAEASAVLSEIGTEFFIIFLAFPFKVFRSFPPP